ncbi:MAG: glycosyltransferase family 2 protein [Chloroflexia bacterium]|nr:glycosyltransferase family 2 protein [Chloroflexia bacterium]
MTHPDFGSAPLLVCLLPVRNAEVDLPDFLANAATFCDAIVALDDGSTDGSLTLLEAHPLVTVLPQNPRREDYRAWDDAANRNRLLAAALALDPPPEWLISLDADERLDARDAASLRSFLETDALPGKGTKVVSVSGSAGPVRAGPLAGSAGAAADPAPPGATVPATVADVPQAGQKRQAVSRRSPQTVQQPPAPPVDRCSPPLNTCPLVIRPPGSRERTCAFHAAHHQR